jgi:hypothetical protein
LWNEKLGIFVDEPSNKPSEAFLERWIAQGHQPLYVVKQHGFIWTTRSRIWALLAQRVVQGRQIGTVDANGAILLDAPELSLPSVLAAQILKRGAGVVLRDASGRPSYGTSSGWSPSEVVGKWIQATRSMMNKNVALERLELARMQRRHHSRLREQRRA